MTTARQLHIMSLIADGLTAIEIGEKLHISPRTVENHLRHMRDEVGAKNTAHLVAIYFRRNWLY